MKQMEQLTAKKEELMGKLQPALDKVKPWIEKADKAYRKGKEIWVVAWPWIWRLRKVLFALPVVWLMWYFARLNWNALPDQVGLNLQITGDYAQYISKELAVYGPMGVTLGCLVMMFLSRRTVYPWLICMISMLLPLLILISNIFPS